MSSLLLIEPTSSLQDYFCSNQMKLRNIWIQEEDQDKGKEKDEKKKDEKENDEKEKNEKQKDEKEKNGKEKDRKEKDEKDIGRER